VLLPRFAELYRKFAQFLVDKRGYEVPRITQCELINVNIIPVAEFGGSFSAAPRAVRLVDIPQVADHLEIESYSYANRFLIINSAGQPIGRLHAHLSPVLSVEDERPAYKLELTARGKPDSSNLDAALAFFGLGRDAINSVFMASTTEAAQTHWGYQHGLRASD
jgi:hypothetical protein